MNVIVAQSAGFCWGVRRAVELARETAAEGGAPLFTDGPLIHNQHMTHQLETSGVRPTDNPEALPPAATLLVRAHGIAPERREWLKRLPLRLIDATCPDVAKIQRIIQEQAGQGRTVLVLGDPGHAEVIGLLGCAGPAGRVVTGPSDVAALPADLPAVCLVSQSTQSQTTFEATARAVRQRYSDAIAIHTICAATRNRQRELDTLAGQCDAFVVVGSPASANTRRLAERAARLRPTVVIDSADELNPGAFAGCATVAVTAGASTPDFIIDNVTARLRAF